MGRGPDPVDLHAWDADLAVDCTYRYLDGGPGSPAFLYVARRWHEVASTPLRGWFGHDRPFAFAPEYVPATGAARFLDGTPPILSMSALDAALDLRREVSPTAAEAKARALTTLFIDLVDARLGFSPLVVRAVDVHDAVEVLHDVLVTGSWDTPEHRAPRTVT